MSQIRLPGGVSETESTEVIWVEEQISCKGLGKQTQIFTASKRTFPLTLVCVGLSFILRDRWAVLMSLLPKISSHLHVFVWPFNYATVTHFQMLV